MNRLLVAFPLVAVLAAPGLLARGRRPLRPASGPLRLS